MLAIVLTAALVSQAQSSAAPTGETEDVASGLQAEGVRKAKYNDIERGFSVRLPVGMLAYLTPATSLNQRFAPGMMMGLELGYDVLSILDIGGFFYYADTSGGGSNTTRDLTTLFGGLMARLSFLHTERVYFGVRGGAGYGLQDNRVERAAQGLGIIAALTVEYYTRIRHFSLALDAGALIWVTTSGGAPVAVGLTITPAIRYTF